MSESGIKAVCLEFRDRAGNESEVCSASFLGGTVYSAAAAAV